MCLSAYEAGGCGWYGTLGCGYVWEAGSMDDG